MPKGVAMQIARRVAAFIAAMALSLSSFAATVMPEQGIVLVNHGAGGPPHGLRGFRQ